ncbi:MAG: NAD synthetase [Candidatus Moranbacteria bacterium]|nr:NAD synthetase [Candidatus Moranbacteria bacterium]
MEIFIKILYVVAAVLFIFGIKLLSQVKSAKKGNLISALGMLTAVIAILLKMNFITGTIGLSTIIAGLVVGGLIGLILARQVPMTAMPELVAVFNGVGGGASAMVALSFLYANKGGSLETVTAVTVVLSLIIGTLTFSGSIIAFLKLKGWIKGEPIVFLGNNYLNLALLLGIFYFAFQAISLSIININEQSLLKFFILMGLALVLGVLLVTPIGGADMPVVISLLNSYSGLAAASTGFVLNNLVLIISGSLVGASGIILTKIMCKAMNRSLSNVLFGGFGQADSSSQQGQSGEYENVKATSAQEVAMLLESVKNVVIIPGYGLAVAQAQHAVQELTTLLEKRGVEVKFAIHPVAGRMPGHMNVLLAEANIDYDKLKDLDEINNEFKNTDFVYVIGANDVVNPAAIEDEQSPIYGMPILNAHEAGTVVIVKRSLSPGFANIKNGLFERSNSLMYFEDAKKATEDIIKELKEL